MRGLACVASLLLMAGPASGQVEVDRTLQVVGGRAITTGDVRRARVLKLTPGASTDAEIQTALENRLLMIVDIGSRQAAPTEADRTARRRAWESSLGAGVDLASLMAQTGTTEAALDAWFADELRLERYQTQRFAAAPDMKAAIDAWIQTLRRRAGLRVRLPTK
jgi:hypothetical protein